MTKRKPLEWLKVDGGYVPDCGPCRGYLQQPHFAAAAASVGISRGMSMDQVAVEAVRQFHEAGHPAREATDMGG